MTAAPSLVLSCPACLQRNRIPTARIADVPICSGCQEKLLPEHPVALTTAGFDRCVGGSELPVLVDFWAGWCAPCRQMAPQFAAAAAALAGKVLFAKVDTEAEPKLAARFRIQGIPTLVLLRQDRELARHSGAMPAAQIQAFVGAHLR